MTDFHLTTAGSLSVHVCSNVELSYSETLLSAYVPGAAISNDAQNKKPDVVLEHRESDEQRIDQDGGRVRIYDHWEREFPLDFYHLLYSVIRKEWLKRGLFSVHAACVGEGDYLLLVGHSGVGKTSVILELLRRSEMRYFSGNKTVVSFTDDGLRALAGTSALTARKEDLERRASMDAHMIAYGERSAMKIQDRFTNRPGSIRAVLLIALNDGASEQIKLSPTSALHTLYGYFLDAMNADTILCNGNDVYSGAPPKNMQQRLAQNLTMALHHIPVYSIKGSMDHLCHAITHI